MNELTIRQELDGIEPSKAKQIEETFAPMVAMLKSFEGKYAELMSQEQTPEKCKAAKRLRLDIAKVRIEADKLRKAQKEQYLRAGNAIQGVYNILRYAVEDKEKALKDVETYYERIEAERKQKLHEERLKLLSEYQEEPPGINLGEMDDAVWENFFNGIKVSVEAAREAERKAEEERKAQEEKQRVFQERREALIPFAQFGGMDELTLETTEDEFKEIIARMEARAKEWKAEQDKIRAENERLRKEKEEREKKERQEAEKKAAEKRKEEEARRKAENAPDAEKLNGWADALEAKVETLLTSYAQAAVVSACTILRDAAKGMAEKSA